MILGLSIEAWITIGTVLGVFLTLLFTKVKAEIAFFTAMAVLCITGVLEFEDSFKGLDSSSVLLVGVLFTVIAGLRYAGALEWIVSHLMGQPKNHAMALIRLMVPVGLLSSFMSNTATTALFQNVVKIWSKKLNVSPSKLLIPLAYAASFGGLLTLIGTPPNLIISSQFAQDTGVRLNLLAPLPVGLCVMIVSIIVVLLMRNFLPTRECPADAGSAETESAKPNTRKTAISLVILAAMLVASSLKILPLTSCCLIAGILMVLTRCCTSEQAFQEVDWRVIIIFAGSICLGTAIEKTGLDDLVVNHILGVSSNPIVVLCAICVVSAILTEMLSDTGCAAMFYPIAYQAATSLGVDPTPFVIALMMSVSNSFATPIATPPNMMVYAAGGYRFGDFARIGIPLKIVTLATAITVTLLIYPLK
ncbi:MAG: SLC13 family permease [Bacteroidales bacterium]|nr:SLC13 family permease [Bacteroidales bacterium]